MPAETSPAMTWPEWQDALRQIAHSVEHPTTPPERLLIAEILRTMADGPAPTEDASDAR